MPKLIPLSLGLWSLIDTEDFDRVTDSGSWYAACRGKYAARRKSGGGGLVYLHKFILPHNMPVMDHINGDTLDNRKENLFPTTYSYNSHNRRISRDNRNVYPNTGGKWQVRFYIQMKRLNYDTYDTEEEARGVAMSIREKLGLPR